MKKLAHRSALLLVLATVLGGCTDPAGGALTGSRWRLDGWSASSLHPSDFSITATFDDRSVGGTSAVNVYRGTYSESGESFSVGEITSTEIAGSEPAMRAERLYLTLLKDARRFERTATRLVLKGESGNDLLYFAPEK